MDDRKSLLPIGRLLQGHHHDWEYQGVEAMSGQQQPLRFADAGRDGPVFVNASHYLVVEACLLCGQQRGRVMAEQFEVRPIRGVRRIVEPDMATAGVAHGR